ncbi:MAG: aldolase/citrate lyase family protein [Cyclobacteriaceae bacterium]|nr:aldolase/citrate lyase family protein [Cyclobacteriaceae bacterium]
MLKSYFFIPASKPKFINKIPFLDVNEFVFDLEDSVLIEETDRALVNLNKNTYFKNFYVRPSLYDINDELELNQLRKLLSMGFNRFVLPKVKNIQDADVVFKLIEQKDHVLLVERPRLLHQLDDVIGKYTDFIGAIGFGCQDFGSYMSMKRETSYMNHALFKIKLIAESHAKEVIDTASMLIDDLDRFKEECVNAFNMGCCGKFVIHPNQLAAIKNASYFSDDELKWAESVFEQIGDKLNDFSIGALKVEGKVLERPHLEKLKLIKKYLSEYE